MLNFLIIFYCMLLNSKTTNHRFKVAEVKSSTLEAGLLLRMGRRGRRNRRTEEVRVT